MDKRGVIFSDMDGTLCFHEQAHGIREVARNADGTVLVADPAAGTTHLAYDVSVSLYRAYLAVETRRLGREIQQRYDFVCVTGGRPATIYARKDALDFADAVILESGGQIFDGDLQPDPEWYARLEGERQHLAGVAARLRNDGWILDDKGRTSGIRIRKVDNPHRSPDEFERLCADLTLPDALKKTINMEHLDVILRSAGKGNAVSFWMQSHGYAVSDSIGIGDDINDLDFLRATGQKYVLASSYPETIGIAQAEGWHISKSPHFDGINEILGHILAL